MCRALVSKLLYRIQDNSLTENAQMSEFNFKYSECGMQNTLETGLKESRGGYSSGKRTCYGRQCRFRKAARREPRGAQVSARGKAVSAVGMWPLRRAGRLSQEEEKLF